MNLLTLFLSIFTLLQVSFSERTSCESFCKYRFCSNLLRHGPIIQPQNRALLLGVPNAALGPIPCNIRSGRPVQFLANLTTGEARVSKEFSGDHFVPISKYQKGVVRPRFPAGFFKWVKNKSNGRDSIARLKGRGNQDKLIDQVCVQMPVKKFNMLRRDGSVKRTVTPRGRRSCIGFRTQVPRLLVDFEWNSVNDFDLRLVEPNGFEINRFGSSQESPNRGQHTFDAGGVACQVEFGREQIRYLSRNAVVEDGVYKIRVDHFRRCSLGSRYFLRVFYDGEVILNESGVISEVGEDIIVRTFKIPSRN